MKHPQYILAILKDAFGPVDAGLNLMGFGAFMERTSKSLFVGRREELERNENFGQVLPYLVLRKGEKVFVYQRTKKVGEERLAGMSSVGVGGHIDFSDICTNDESVIDIMATLAQAITREMKEEIGFKGEKGPLTLKDLREGGFHLLPRFQGLINDTSNPVGRVHYGALFIIDIPDGYEPYCLEEELTTRGMIDISALKTEVLESWSNIVTEFLGAAK